MLSPENLALVQAKLGVSLRDVYVQMLLLALGTLACTAWLPGKSAGPISPPRSQADPDGTEPELALSAMEP